MVPRAIEAGLRGVLKERGSHAKTSLRKELGGGSARSRRDLTIPVVQGIRADFVPNAARARVAWFSLRLGMGVPGVMEGREAERKPHRGKIWEATLQDVVEI